MYYLTLVKKKKEEENKKKKKKKEEKAKGILGMKLKSFRCILFLRLHAPPPPVVFFRRSLDPRCVLELTAG